MSTEKINLKQPNPGLRREYFRAAQREEKVAPLTSVAQAPAKLQYQYGAINADGSVRIKKALLPDGAALILVSKRVIKTLDPEGRFLSFEVDLSEVRLADRGEMRAAVGRKIAREVLGLLNLSETLCVPLGNFLADIDEYGGRTTAAIRLSVAGPNIFQLIAGFSDGTHQLVAAQFLQPATFRGKASAAALTVMHPITKDAIEYAPGNRDLEAIHYRQRTVQWAKKTDRRKGLPLGLRSDASKSRSKNGFGLPRRRQLETECQGQN